MSDRAGTVVFVALVLAAFGLVGWTAVGVMHEERDWRSYRRAHRCIETGDIGGKTTWECDGKAMIR